MKRPCFFGLVGILTMIFMMIWPAHLISQKLTTPKDFFGFDPGSDRKLINYQQLIDYFKTLEQQSRRISITEIGRSHFNNPIFVVAISSEENIQQLENLKAINKTLATDVALSHEKAQELAKQGKAFVLATLSMHSNEVGPTQAAPLIAFRLLSTQHPDTLNWLKNCVYLMVPCHNPDGLDMVVEWYNKNLGTSNEGTIMPGVYHKYVGHNINRDFVMLTQPENVAVSKLTSHEWFPQVMVEKHQMGMTGPRYFVPPHHDPIAQNVDESLWSWIGVFGSAMLNDMTNVGLQGIAQQYEFDNYWPGSTETCLWKNVISLLTEAASVKYATPVFIEKNELKVSGKGLAEYEKSVRFIKPWEGGWWRLSDIVRYEEISTFSLIKTAAQHKNELLQLQHRLCIKEYQKGKNQQPFYFILPKNQHDMGALSTCVELMKTHGINVFTLEKNITIDHNSFSKGDIVVPLAQPFRAFIKEVFETQNYPERHYTLNGDLIRPYDVTSWSIPLMLGLISFEIDTRSTELESNLKPIESLKFEPLNADGQHQILNVNYTQSYQIAFQRLAKGERVFLTAKIFVVGNDTIPEGSFVIENSGKYDKSHTIPIILGNAPKEALTPLKMPNIVLIESWAQDMDAGWTRYLFDTYSIPYNVIRPEQLKDRKTLKNIEVVIFPSESPDILLQRDSKQSRYGLSRMPQEYIQGIGDDGMENLWMFVENGGKIIAWGESTELFLGRQKVKKNNQIVEFELPAHNVYNQLSTKGLEASELHIKAKGVNHRLMAGMKPEFPIFFSHPIIFETQIPYFDTDRRVVAFVADENPRISGYIKNEKLLKNKALIVSTKKGKGEIILFAFCPQFRGQTYATFKLVFNAILP